MRFHFNYFVYLQTFYIYKHGKIHKITQKSSLDKLIV
jgi:hypothetical protein